MATVAVVAILVTGASFFFLFPLKPTSTPYNLTLKSATFYRSVMARMYSFNVWSLPSTETPTTVGNAIASMNASFVSGLIRLEAGAVVSSQMLADYGTVRGIVLAANPHAKFDIWFRADKLNYDPAQMIAQMQGVINSGMQVDAFSFDSLNNVPAAALQAIIQFAHSNGRMIGGPCFVGCAGLDYITSPNITVIPNGFSITDPFASIYINNTAMAEQAKFGIPIMLGLPNGGIPVDSGTPSNTFHRDFVLNFTDTQRSNIIKSLAEQQAANYYGFTYPVFFPVGQVGPPSLYWDSPHDGNMLQLMVGLAATYNPHP